MSLALRGTGLSIGDSAGIVIGAVHLVQGSFAKSSSGMRGAPSSASREGGGSLRSSCTGRAARHDPSGLHDVSRPRGASNAGTMKA